MPKHCCCWSCLPAWTLLKGWAVQLRSWCNWCNISGKYLEQVRHDLSNKRLKMWRGAFKVTDCISSQSFLFLTKLCQSDVLRFAVAVLLLVTWHPCVMGKRSMAHYRYLSILSQSCISSAPTAPRISTPAHWLQISSFTLQITATWVFYLMDDWEQLIVTTSSISQMQRSGLLISTATKICVAL